MISGLNIDVEFEGSVYHVQTESGGKTSPVIQTTVFKGGAILAARKSSFEHLLDSPQLIPELKDLMSKQHKNTIKELKAGEIVKSKGGPKPEKNEASSPGAGTPKRSGVQGLDDMILDYLASKEEKGP